MNLATVVGVMKQPSTTKKKGRVGGTRPIGFIAEMLRSSPHYTPIVGEVTVFGQIQETEIPMDFLLIFVVLWTGF